MKIEDLYTAKVRGKSADGTVAALMTINGIRVRLAPNCLRHHDADSLATAVRAALNGVISGWGKVNDRLGPGDADTMNSHRAEELAPLLEELAKLTVIVKHPVVKLGIRQGETKVAFTEEALKRTEADLTEDLNTAVADLLRAHRQRVTELYESHVADR